MKVRAPAPCIANISKVGKELNRAVPAIILALGRLRWENLVRRQFELYKDATA